MPGSAAAGMPGLVAGYFLRTTVVLILALLAAAAARRRPAALRHFVLSSALIGLLLLPLLSLVPAGWRSPLVPGWMAPAAEHASGPPSGAGSESPCPTPVSEAPDEAAMEFGGRSNGTGRGTIPLRGTAPFSIRESEAGGQTANLPTAVSKAVSGVAGRRPAAAPRFPGLVIAALWSAGFAILVLRLAVGLAGAIRLTAGARPLGSPAWRSLLERFLALVPIRRRVRLRGHPEVLVPLTWGWRKPVILLPAGADAWTEEERSSALFHELSHVKRADFLVMLLVRLSLAVFWWNPRCWIVYRELLKEQEIACDELVLRAGIRPSSYAASLLAFRRSAGFRWNPSTALLGMLGRSSFQERLAAILKQRIILMEVKMKTKIMLASVVVLAVAFVGTARPVSAGEAGEVSTALAETMLPAPVPFEIAPPGIPSQEREVAKTIVIKPQGATGAPIEITITEGDQVKTLVLEKPLTITKSKDGQTITLTVDGKDVQVLKGEPLRLEIKGGGLQIVHEPGVIKVDEVGGVRIIKERGKEGETVVYYGTIEPETAHGKVKIVKRGEPGMAWTVTEGGKAYAFSTVTGDKDMLEKVRALQEQVQAVKARKLDITALEESLKKLEAELRENEKKLRELNLKVDKAPGEFAIVKRVGGDEPEGKPDVWIMTQSKTAKEATAKVMIGVDDENDRTISLILTGQEGEAGKAAFERAVVSLKKDLPEGYKLTEQKHDEESGTMTFKIAVPEGKKTDEALIRRLVDSVQAAAKAQK